MKDERREQTNWFTLMFFFPLAVAMYYFSLEAVHIGMDWMYKILIGGVIVLMALVSFGVSPNLARLKVLFRYTLLLSLPYIVVLSMSFLIWTISRAPLSAIFRGTTLQVYQILGIMVAASSLYLFGRRGFWINVAAMCTANMIVVGEAVAMAGPASFFQQLWQLIITFGEETGEAMAHTEVHDLTFALGMIVLYLLLEKKENAGRHPFLFLIALFCFVCGFKRIAIGALAVGLLVGVILSALYRKWKNMTRRLIQLLCFVLIVLAYWYLVKIRGGMFSNLESTNISTMGRDYFYQEVQSLYTLTPNFLGYGAGYLNIWSYQDTGYAIHNDFLMMYIDCGFWGFLFWLICSFPVRIQGTMRIQDTFGGALCTAIVAYNMVNYLTDNTVYYFYVSIALGLVVMTHQLGEQEQREYEAIEHQNLLEGHHQLL